MGKVKNNIAQNLKTLRKARGITQQQLAKEFNYSNKAVSRWEKAEALPSVDVLESLCEYYGVSFEWLIKEQNEAPKPERQTFNKIAVMCLVFLFTIALATIVFVYNQIMSGQVMWRLFVWAVPIACLLILIICYKWWNKYVNLGIFSATFWTLIVAVYLEFLQMNIWPLFFLGLPIQAIAVLITIIKK